MKMSEIYAAPEGRGELGLLSMYHEQIRDMLAAANLELFPCTVYSFLAVTFPSISRKVPSYLGQCRVES